MRRILEVKRMWWRCVCLLSISVYDNLYAFAVGTPLCTAVSRCTSSIFLCKWTTLIAHAQPRRWWPMLAIWDERQPQTTARAVGESGLGTSHSTSSHSLKLSIFGVESDCTRAHQRGSAIWRQRNEDGKRKKKRKTVEKSHHMKTQCQVVVKSQL